MTAPPALSVPASVRARGFAVVPDVFGRAETDGLADTAMQVAAGEMAARPHEDFTVDRDRAGNAAPRKVDYPFLKHDALRAFALDPRLQQLADLALGHRGYLMRDQVFCKPPRFGTAKPYHQENASVLYEPADAMVVTWVALDDATADNGCLRVIEGSHIRLWPHAAMPGASFNHVPPPEAIDLRREVVLPVTAGSVVVLHSQVLHASHPNPSDQWRRAYTAHWTTADAVCRTDAQRHGYSLTAGGGEHCAYRAP